MFGRIYLGKPSGPGLLFPEKYLIIDLISLLVICSDFLLLLDAILGHIQLHFLCSVCSVDPVLLDLVLAGCIALENCPFLLGCQICG